MKWPLVFRSTRNKVAEESFQHHLSEALAQEAEAKLAQVLVDRDAEIMALRAEVINLRNQLHEVKGKLIALAHKYGDPAP